MTAFLHQLGLDPAFLKSAFEWSLLSLFLACLVHSFWVHGPHRTVREFVAGFFLTAFCESTGVLSGAYIYPGFTFYIFATPVANPASWIATVYIIIEVTNRIVYRDKALRTYEADGFRMRKENFTLFGGSLVKTLLVLALLDAVFALAVDIILDPLATIYNWWVWVPCSPGVTDIGPGVVEPYNFTRQVFMTTPQTWIGDFFARFFPNGNRYPTRVLGIPLINFIAWLVFVFVFTFQFRFVEFRETWGEWKKTAVLWALVLLDVPVMALALIIPNL
ncbi:MAG: carotenoid biosynthesis protein [Deltaproteobacteria bacterium]|nr:carotenoid biosynthesis protein [Deltaproteobacteria bacterium]